MLPDVKRVANDESDDAPIVVISFPGIGDFVRSHTAVQLIRERNPGCPIDMVGQSPATDIAFLMPGVREGIAEPFGGHSRLHFMRRMEFAKTLRSRGYRKAYILSRSWKPAIAPFFAGIPERVGWWGEARFLVINRPRIFEYRNRRMVDQLAALALDRGEKRPREWPEPRIDISPAMLADFRRIHNLPDAGRLIAAIAPGSTDELKNWPIEQYATLARWLVRRGYAVWVLGAAFERPLAERLRELAGGDVQVATESSLLTSTYRVAAADIFIGNDSGLLHIAAALGKPSVGIYTFTDPFLAGPINRNVRFVLPPLRYVRHRRPSAHWPETEAVIEAVEAAMTEVEGAATSRQKQALG
ncbi:MAG: lipopolysaccharide heptosyltransferase II [Pseudorhodoplanes sp.]|nr:lipopolysaccharide heptosyltransferase II [Pseudorhodoplanes sp.]